MIIKMNHVRQMKQTKDRFKKVKPRFENSKLLEEG